MSVKTVSLLFLAMLPVVLPACSSDNADIEVETLQSASSTMPSESEPKLAATEVGADALVQAEANAQHGAVDASSNEVASALGVEQAETFQAIYTATCMQYLLKLDELRSNIEVHPKFPDEQASQLLPNGTAGSAWPVPAKTGNYILAIPDDISLCAIYAKDLDTELTNQQFIDIYNNPPAPFVATQMSNTTEQRENGVNTNLSYSWSAPDMQKMLFMLTTDDSGNTKAKAMYTASIMSE